jgi:uncharacterized protein (DUF433 family)
MFENLSYFTKRIVIFKLQKNYNLEKGYFIMRKESKNLVELNPAIMVGKPIFRGTRIPFECALRELAGGWTEEEVIKAHPMLNHEHILAAMDYAADTLANEEVFLA